jgi:hypothetical protein
MKKLLLLLCCFASGTSFSQALLAQGTILGSVNPSNGYLLTISSRELLSAINGAFPKKGFDFDSVTIDSSMVNGQAFYFLKARTAKSNRTLVKWLDTMGAKLVLRSSEMPELKMLNTFFICEGESDCYPRLLFVQGQYGWSCRNTNVCVSDQLAKEHPCTCTKGNLF